MNENHSVDTPQKATEFPMVRLLSWLTTGIVAALCLLLVPLAVRVIPIYSDMFHGLEVQLPWPTRILSATYYWLLPSLFVALAVFVICKEYLIHELRRRFVLTARVFFAALITMGIVIFLLYLPLLTLASKLGIAK
jgi:hypothetical protein